MTLYIQHKWYAEQLFLSTAKQSAWYKGPVFQLRCTIASVPTTDSRKFFSRDEQQLASTLCNDCLLCGNFDQGGHIQVHRPWPSRLSHKVQKPANTRLRAGQLKCALDPISKRTQDLLHRHRMADTTPSSGAYQAQSLQCTAMRVQGRAACIMLHDRSTLPSAMCSGANRYP